MAVRTVTAGTTTAATSAIVTQHVVRAMLDEARRKNYDGGVLGVRARPVWEGPAEFEHRGTTVRIVPCTSTLAVREALSTRRADQWLVILTEQDDRELGTGITAHLINGRLRTPDPWDAIRQRFQAQRLDHGLVTGAGSSDLAAGILALSPDGGWPPARAGFLSRDHLFGALALPYLDLGTPGGDLETGTILGWTCRPDTASKLAGLREQGGDAVADALLAWVAQRTGTIGKALAPLFRSGQVSDAVPLGLAARATLRTEPKSGPRALLRHELGEAFPDSILSAWAAASESVVTRLLESDDDHTATRVLTAAERFVTELEIDSVEDSDLLPQSLTARLATLGEALHQASVHAAVRADVDGPDSPLIDAELLPSVEEALRRVNGHRLARHSSEVRVDRALAGVRLARWLARPATGTDPPTIEDLIVRYRDHGAWAHRAIADAWTGVGDEALARGLGSVLSAARLREDGFDGTFAGRVAAVAAEGTELPGNSLYLENVLPELVLPLARQRPVLLVVADGMSLAVATEIIDSLEAPYHGWSECVRDGITCRTTGIAVLPTLTTLSRTSLLSGELARGQQSEELAGFERARDRVGVTGKLFHKQPIESSAGGYALSHDVADAIGDTSGNRLVACVLNTIDDSLDRSDPGGIEWTADAVKHLRPLLERAHRSGRTVVLTSDHGHVVERRERGLRTATDISSNRSRAASGGAAEDGEVRVRGRRVLDHDGDAVLAVDERLRYGPLKAGYHGGASPAEVVVPVCILTAGAVPDGWTLAPPQAPAWWRGPISLERQAGSPGIEEVEKPALRTRARKRDDSRQAALFPEADTSEAVPPGSPAPSPAAKSGARTVKAVLASATYEAQRERTARGAISDGQISQLLEALLAAPDNRIGSESAAAALGIASVKLGLALPQLQRILNVEQYPVLRRDPDGDTLVLDRQLLFEQFGVSP